MAKSYDVIVIGLGAIGGAAAYHLALRGKSVLGLDQHTPPHNRGSSHGRSRIIRQAYYEGSDYVPLLLRAYELWQQLERDTDSNLLTITGGLMIGQPNSRVFSGSLLSARRHGLHHDVLDRVEIRRRFPPLTPEPGMMALFERMAGFIHAEKGVIAHLQRAAELGATLQFGERVHSWQAFGSNDRVTVVTERGRYDAERLVVSAGPWAPQLLADCNLPMTIERQVLYWFDPIGGIAPFRPERFPIYIWSIEDGLEFYGFPAQDERPGGVKVAFFGQGVQCSPESIDREVYPDEIDRIRKAIAGRIPALNGPLVEAVTCMYTSTPDHHFIIGSHPAYANVFIASPCSGHGYKFASVVGEILASLAIGVDVDYPVEMFSPLRFRAIRQYSG